VAHQALFRDGAFTLLDLITGLAICGVLAAIAVPNWASQLPTYRLNSAARQLQSELHWVKSQAVARSAHLRVVFLAPAAYRIDRKEGAGYRPAGEQKTLPEGITFGGGNIGPIGFAPRGTADGGTITLCNDKREGKNIIVSGSTGRVRVAGAAC
jgi:type II secretory pathway pseudopilin PulG